MKKTKQKIILGWCEYFDLPLLGVSKIKAKLDTGAATSAIDASHLEIYEKSGEKWVKCLIYPHGRNNKSISIDVKIAAQRSISDSSGFRQKRYIIKTELEISGIKWEAEISLADRATMRVPMLIGRKSLKRKFLVNPSRRFVVVALS